MDFSRQKDEIEVIESIFDAEELSTFVVQSQHYLKFNAFQTAPQPVTLSFKKLESNNACGSTEVERSLSVSYLPPIELDLELPKDYPSKSPPCYSISCMWLSSEDLQSICEQLDQMWSNNTEVLFQWAQFLKDDALNLLTNNFQYAVKPQPEKVEDLQNDQKQSSPVTENSKLEVNNNRKSDPRTFKRNSLVFYNKKFDGQICNLDGDVQGPENSRRWYRKSPRWTRRPKRDASVASTSANVVSVPSNQTRLCNQQAMQAHQSNGSVKQAQSRLDESKIKKCSENYNEKYLIKHLESYNVERELSEFRKTYFTCYICFEDKFGLSCVRFQPCRHVYCRDCIRSYLQTRIAEGSVQMIKCPNTDCDSIILPVQVREIVGKEEFSKYDQLLLTAMLDTQSDMVRCPRIACQYPVTKEPDEKMALCPGCSYAFCVQCKMGYHGVEPCRFKHHEKEALLKEYLNGDEEVRRKMEQKYGKTRLGNLVQTSLSEKWIDNNSKNCPNCNASIEKSEGCNKMLCWRCSTYFCWNCLTRLDVKAPYAHYYDRNSPCYNRLFEGAPNEDDDEVFVVLDGFDDEEEDDEDFFDDYDDILED
ncbi:E3 ubiquitin-protein ligase RNF14 [Nilaparvata lugens]|uniref:E3 ubiquitin-protein ligase RNF14 n=1 Tax=Nilaparvata lugens TaxID=108931 RepID=UPI00193DB534|nr:E3 ubiquitin-protein ligase RNF14 [Nilaparvata lugens]XP_039284676.1 E3 ubiquitin-protein ligase RNF14 [Nilaparvata lugens]XP_039284677.1 E3 ubiquitin-protein ligase RNF14 [Nilaparvata lugens]